MRTESLLGIALELIEIVAEPGRLPADARVGRFFRSRRFLGSQDRRLIGNAVFAWLRHFPRARARWRSWCMSRGVLPVPETIEAPMAPSVPARISFLEDILILSRDELFPWSFEEALEAARGLAHREEEGEPGFLQGEHGSLKDLLEKEPVLAAFRSDASWPEDPTERLAAELSFPLWLARRLIEEEGVESTRRLGAALLEPAPVDLRVNLGRALREAARASLEEELGCLVHTTTWSPLGLRIAGRKSLAGTFAGRQGWIEVEDEGSQIAVLSTDPAPGETVVDACAGAGGKALAFADLLLRRGRDGKREGRLVACDIDPSKLEELRRRAEVAEVAKDIERVLVAPQGQLPPGVPAADLLLIDAPCSGLGTLRRNPDLKLRYGPADLPVFAALQRAILERFSPLVKPGGRLAYATCSLLGAENEDVASAFEAAHSEFEAYPSRWAREHLPKACIEGGHVRINPVLTGTDGFFLALWRRR